VINKPNVIAVIGARLNSSRLPGKHLMPLAGKPLIERVVERLETCERVDQIILATTHDAYNEPLIHWGHHLSLPVYAHEGDVNDLMGRIDAVVKLNTPTWIVYVCGDCPLIEPTFIDHALQALQSHPDSDTVHLRDGIQSIHEGLHFYSLKGWEKLIDASKSVMSREHVGYANREKTVLASLAIDDSDDFSMPKHRISVDTMADYQFMSAVYERWYSTHGQNEIVSLKWVQRTLRQEPLLLTINSHVRQKKPNQAYPSVSIFCHYSAAIGLGHLRRCARIAGILQENLGLGTHIHIQGEKIKFPWLSGNVSWHNDEAQLQTAFMTETSALALLDFKIAAVDVDTWKGLLTQQHNNGIRLIALDQLSALHSYVDLAFVPSFYSDIQADNLSCGWENYLLTPVTNRPVTPPYCLVLTGGSDALGFGNYLPDILDKAVPAEYEILWVQGPLAPAPQLADDSRIAVLESVHDLQNLIAGASCVVSSYGLSLFEAITSGAAILLLPSTGIVSTHELLALKAQQVCLVADTDDAIERQLSTITQSAATREALRKSARRYGSKVDGCMRLTQAVESLLQHSPTT